MWDDIRFWIGFNRAKGVGPVRLQQLIAYFGNIERAWMASEGELRASKLLESRTIASILACRKTLDLEAEVRQLEKLKIAIVIISDTDYPALLRTIPDPPPLLYVQGRLPPSTVPLFSVIGTRRATAYGRQATTHIVRDLVGHGLGIVSGLAVGIDAAAHQAVLDEGGITVAVQPNGLDTIYPPEHRQLAQQILERGAVISEHPLGEAAERSHFPPRNRIMAGLSHGVLIVEADDKSGAMITADFALEYGRDVYAVPGSIFSPSSRGVNKLIQSGAKLVLSAADIVEELGSMPASQLSAERGPKARSRRAALPEQTEPALHDPLVRVAPEALPPSAETVMQCLMDGPLHIDELSRRTAIAIADLSAVLWLLFERDLVKETGVLQFAVVVKR